VIIMDMVKAEVKLPESFLTTLKVRKEELDLFIRRSLAVELYRDGQLSLGKAAELAGLDRWEMLQLLNEKEVPLHYTASDAEKDLKTLKEVPNP
jgi:predicted HTH domain antitoxin